MNERTHTMVLGSVLGALSVYVGCAATGPDREVGGAGNHGGSSADDGSAAQGGNSGGQGESGAVSIDSGGGAAGAGGSAGSGFDSVLIDECPGPLDAGVVSELQAGGPVPAEMDWLYPYDGSVFPRRIAAPVLQWKPAPPKATAIYLHLKSKYFDYKGCFDGADPARLAIPDSAWEAALAKSSGPGDPLLVELTTSDGTTVSGPITQNWTIAIGNLKGEIFYSTYNTPQVGSGGGAVMRLVPGTLQTSPYIWEAQALPWVGPCVSCHSLSANGGMLAAQRHDYLAGTVQSFAYDVAANPSSQPPSLTQHDDAGFSAIFPDGSRLLTNGSPAQGSAITPDPSNVAGMFDKKESRLFDARTGAAITTTGFDVKYAKMPMFSPDGTRIVFNDHDNGGGHSLTVMDFDAQTNTFSKRQEIFRDPKLYPGWPFFTPDSKAVVFVLGNRSDFVSSHSANATMGVSDLYHVHIATKTAVKLARAGGFEGQKSYLPYGPRDEHLDFFPTVSPVAAGGYFWVFFTSRRNYGNTIVGDVTQTESKKIWVSAIRIGAEVGTDPSSPAFYLPGQEPESGNVRAFATLEPCRDEGALCSSGIDCCCGACAEGVCACPQGCSKIDEKCSTAADCCDAQAECINGFCALVVK